jgi:phosphohistidine phosphatase
MDLYLLRHAIAVSQAEAGVNHDSDRPLSSEGESRMRQAAKGMKTMGLAVDLILSSPLLRAQQTARIAAEDLGAKKPAVHLTPSLEPDEPPQKFVKELHQWPGGPPSAVLAVGHEPHLSGLISFLVAGDRDRITVTMKKGGLCRLTLESLKAERGARLEWLLAPRHLRQLA